MIVKPKNLVISLAVLLLLLIGTASFFRAPNAREISKALDTTIIDQLWLKEATVNESLSLVMDHLHQQNPEMRQVCLKYYPSAEGVSVDSAKTLVGAAGVPAIPDFTGAHITVNLSNIPANEALKYVTSLSNCGYAVRSGKIYIYAAANRPPVTISERFAMCVDWLSSRIKGVIP